MTMTRKEFEDKYLRLNDKGEIVIPIALILEHHSKMLNSRAKEIFLTISPGEYSTSDFFEEGVSDVETKFTITADRNIKIIG